MSRSRTSTMRRLAVAGSAVLLGALAVSHPGSAPRPARADGPTTIDPYRELMIVHPSVIDPYLNGLRSHNGTATSPGGRWSLRHLLEQMGAPAGATARNNLYASLFESWLTVQVTTNGTTLPPRDLDKTNALLDRFAPKDATGKRIYQLWKLPFELMAIVNRIDLHRKNPDGSPSGADAGELRFVYRLTDHELADAKFTLNVEYKLRTTHESVETWAQNWHRLSTLPIGSEEYLKALEILTLTPTTLFGTPPALAQIRTNELHLADPAATAATIWQMREFIQQRTGLTGPNKFVPSAVRNTPRSDLRFVDVNGRLQGNPEVYEFIAANSMFVNPDCANPGRVCLDDPGTEWMDFQFPEQIPSPSGPVTFLAPAANTGLLWTVEFDDDPANLSDAMNNFGMLTCNGCHEDNKDVGLAPSDPRDMRFYHISPEVAPGQDGLARLSRFLTVNQSPRRPGELNRRTAILTTLLARPWTPIWFF